MAWIASNTLRSHVNVDLLAPQQAVHNDIKLTFYENPPTNDISIHDFEIYALDRLRGAPCCLCTEGQLVARFCFSLERQAAQFSQRLRAPLSMSHGSLGCSAERLGACQEPGQEGQRAGHGHPAALQQASQGTRGLFGCTDRLVCDASGLQERQQEGDTLALVLQGVDAAASRLKDAVSHFALRLAFCTTEDNRRWLLTQECELFRHRFVSQLPREQARLPATEESHIQRVPQHISGLVATLQMYQTSLCEGAAPIASAVIGCSPLRARVLLVTVLRFARHVCLHAALLRAVC